MSETPQSLMFKDLYFNSNKSTYIFLKSLLLKYRCLKVDKFYIFYIVKKRVIFIDCTLDLCDESFSLCLVIGIKKIILMESFKYHCIFLLPRRMCVQKITMRII